MFTNDLNRMDGRQQQDGSITERWLQRHADLYHAATRHIFTLSIRDGTLDLECFKRWLGQDYLFVRSFVRFAASSLAKLPSDADEADMDTLLAGLTALQQEISWFKQEGLKWGLQFVDIVPQVANKDYCRFLKDLADTEIGVMLAAFWGIEVVYNESFAACLGPGVKTPAELQHVCERWGSDGFRAYCTALQSMVDKYIMNSPAYVQEKAEHAFLEVLSKEVNFWNMSIDSSS